MKQITKYVGMVAIMSIFALAAVSGQIDVASAEKAEGSQGSQSPKSYGSATDDIVCGASLCSTPEGEVDPVNVGRAQ